MAAAKPEELFPLPVDSLANFAFRQLELGPDEQLPHGTHPSTSRVASYRTTHGLNPIDIPAANTDVAVPPAWGVWAPIPPPPHQTMDMPPEYMRCIRTVERPFDILCGHRLPSSTEEGDMVCKAVEAMFAAFIELMLVIQLKNLEIHDNYKLLSKDSIQRHAACVILGKGPTDMLTQADLGRFTALCRRKIAPFEEALQTYDCPTLLQFFDREIGTLYIFGIPVMSTRVRNTEPGWRQANKFLEIVGSKLRLRLCVLGSSTELLLYEPIAEKCTSSVVVAGVERARTAMLAFEVASTQDTSENPVKMFRTEATAFIVHHKWDIARIEQRDWDLMTYGPTQKLTVLHAQRLLHGDAHAIKQLLYEHCTESLIEYQAGEQMVNDHSFTPLLRGVLHALFSRHVPLEDMHSLLVDTIKRPARLGILPTIMCHENIAKARIRLLMYTTDTWFGSNRLYSVLIVGAMAAAIRPDQTDIDFMLLDRVLADLHALTVKALTWIAECAHRRLRGAQYRVLSHLLRFDAVADILTRQYHRNDGRVDVASLRFNSSFWINILGYYVRMTNGTEALDAEILSLVHAFIDDAIALLCVYNPHLKKATGVRVGADEDDSLRRRLVAYFEIFATAWDTFVKSSYRQSANGEPPAKRQKY